MIVTASARAVMLSQWQSPRFSYTWIAFSKVKVMKIKHFKLLARVLVTFKDDIPRETYAQMVGLLCKSLVHFNKGFKADLFKADCEVRN